MITLLEMEMDNFKYLLYIEFVLNINDEDKIKEEAKKIYDSIDNLFKNDKDGNIDVSSLLNNYKDFYDVLLNSCEYNINFNFFTETKNKNNLEKFFSVVLTNNREKPLYNVPKKFENKVDLIKKIYSTLDNVFFKRLYVLMYDEYNKNFPKTFETSNRILDTFLKYIYKTLDKNIMLKFYSDSAFKAVVVFALVFYSLNKETPDVKLSLFFNKSYTLVDFNLFDTDVSEKTPSELNFKNKILSALKKDEKNN